MPTKRKRPSGSFEYKITRKGLLPEPVYFTFAGEAEGDEYVRRLEALLHRGIVPDELTAKSANPKTLRVHHKQYISDQHISEADRACLPIVIDRLPAALELRELSFTWATAWVTKMKREENLAPSTLRHHVGALARCLDWVAAHGDLTVNPLRLLRKGYAKYTPEDTKAVRANDQEPKADTERDRRLHDGEEDAIREILAGKKPEGRQRALELRDGPALRMLFDLALESAMRMREMYTLDVVARAEAQIGDKIASRGAYEQFFAAWKDADPDLPVLGQARQEYSDLMPAH